MQKANFSLKRLFIYSSIAILLTGFLTACDKDLDDDNTPVPSAGLMVFNLVPDREAIGVALSGNAIGNAPLEYTSFNGAYQRIFIGARDIETFDFRTDSLLAKTNFSFEDSSFYSVFVVGSNGKYNNITVEDEVDSNATADRAYIRYINAIPDSSAPVVTIEAGGNNVADGPAAFGEVTEFTPINGGDVTIAVSNGSSISANRTISLENGKAYTALLVGLPDATDTTQKVQIRYIENGTVGNPTAEK